MNSQRSDSEKINIIEEGKKIGINEIIKHNKIISNVSSVSNGKATILSKCTICGSKKSRFIKNQEAKVLSSNLGICTPLSKVPSIK